MAVHDRFIEACITGDKVARCMSLRSQGVVMRDRATIHRIAALDQVHPLAQHRFLANWTRMSVWQRIRAKIADDDLFFAALRKLLPGTDPLSPAIMLYRGQPKNELLGMSWTLSPGVAELFSHWQSLPERGGVIFYARLSEEIICAPCELGHHEGEYIVDPRGVVAGFYNPWDDDPRA